VPCHFNGQASHLPAASAQADAEFRLFAGDERVVVADDFRQRRGAHQGIAAASLRIADRRIPFQIAQTIVNRSLGVTFAAASAHDGQPGLGIQLGDGARQPTVADFAVAVDELHVL
jgi:hypothetical protein